MQHQAITSVNADLLLVGYLEANFSGIWFQIRYLYSQNAFQYTVCKIGAILYSLEVF